MGELVEVSLLGESFVGFGEKSLVEEFDRKADNILIGKFQIERHFSELNELFKDLFVELSFQDT